MPRKPRDVSPGFHHAWVGATGDWSYFLDEVDRIAWIRRLVSTLDRMAWTCVAFCQMSTHVHLLLRIPDESLAIGMRDLNREYSCDFNLRHGRVGTFVRKRSAAGGSTTQRIWSASTHTSYSTPSWSAFRKTASGSLPFEGRFFTQ